MSWFEMAALVVACASLIFCSLLGRRTRRNWERAEANWKQAEANWREVARLNQMRLEAARRRSS